MLIPAATSGHAAVSSALVAATDALAALVAACVALVAACAADTPVQTEPRSGGHGCVFVLAAWMDLAAVDMDRGSNKTEAACDGSSIVDPVALQEITVDAASPSELSTHQRSLVAGARSACGET